MYRVGHLESSIPLANDAGSVKTPEQFEAIIKTRIEIPTFGSTTLEEKHENKSDDGTTHKYLPDIDAYVNSRGLPNEGMDYTEKHIYPDIVRMANSFGKKVIASVAVIGEDPVKESLELVRRTLNTGVHGVALNISCPNVLGDDGIRHESMCFNPTVMDKLFNSLSEIDELRAKPLIVKVAPFPDYPSFRRAMQQARPNIIGGIIASNSFEMPNREFEGEPRLLKVRNETVGLSGKATAPKAREQLKFALTVARNAGRNIDVVSTNGIYDGKELYRRINLGKTKRTGASLGTIVSPFYRHEMGAWSEIVDKYLAEYEAYDAT